MAIFYNSVSLPFALTENHVTEGEHDPSGVDTTLFKTRVTTTGIIHPGDYPTQPGESVAQTVDRITHLLCSPRRTLRYSAGGQEITVVPGVDDENGPTPEPGAFSIKSVAEGSYLVTFAVSYKLRRCAGADARGFLSLKWADGVNYLQDWTCVRRRTGLLITSRVLRSPDELRHVVTPAVHPGFRRETADYELSEDGLRLRFTFIDRQLHKPVPWAGVRMTGHQVETVPRGGGMRRGELSLRLSGVPGTDPRDLLGAAISVGLARVYASRPQLDTYSRQILMGCTVRESLADSETTVELGLEWMISPAGQRTGGAIDRGRDTLRGVGYGGLLGAVIGGLPGAISGAITGGIAAGSRPRRNTPEGRPQAAVPALAGWLGTLPPNAVVGEGIAPPTRGIDLAGTLRLYAAALMDPCGSKATLNPATADNYLVGTDLSTGATTTLRTGPAADPTTETVYLETESPGVWEHWQMTYSFTTDSGYLVVPSTKPGEKGSKVRVGNRRKRLRVEWELRQTGDAPHLPDPVVPRLGGFTGDGVHDPNWIGLTNTTTYQNNDTTADGVTFVYTAAGESTWEALDPNTPEGYPIPPWLAPVKRPQLGTMTATKPTGGTSPFDGPPHVHDPSNPFSTPAPLP